MDHRWNRWWTRAGLLAAGCLALACADETAEDVEEMENVEQDVVEAPTGEAGEPAATGAASELALEVQTYEGGGRYLTDDGGRALYLFTADTRATAGAKARSTCTGPCLEAWPPVLVEDAPDLQAEALDPALVGTIRRDDGRTQLTYGGWPLYTFTKDRGPGATTGQDKHGFGGEWYLLTPEGEKLEAEE